MSKISHLNDSPSITLLRRKERSLRPWMNAWREPYEAHKSVVGYASEGSALRSMWRSHGLRLVGAPLLRDDFIDLDRALLIEGFDFWRKGLVVC